MDFPIPGSPPRRMKEPSTSPPPRTRSSSGSPRLRRLSLRCSMSPRRTGLLAVMLCAVKVRLALSCLPMMISSSSMEFHTPHCEQKPCHLGYSAPHSVQW